MRAVARTPSSTTENNPRAFAASHKPVNERLLDACQRVPDNPRGASAAMFIAAPERLMAKLAYLSLDKTKSLDPKDASSQLPADTVSSLSDYETDGQNAVFSNLESEDRIKGISKVLLCHGLSPIGDSILLLADIGRAYRMSRVMGAEMRVMLADISWMSSNRSISQFQTLSQQDIDTGLRVCLDKRSRLYGALSMHTDRHDIVPYNRSGKISGKKLEHISSRYSALSRLLWGNVDKRLEREHVRLICRNLDKSIVQGETPASLAIETLSQFRGVLSGLENNLKPHLEILRVIAKEFNSFDEDVFKYFFAQYYAQDTYRGKSLKIAPISEQTFDRPFDELDVFFRAWGEGHSTTDLLTAQEEPHSAPPMSAIYYPQYSIGHMSVLPYTPLSLDALKLEAKDHTLVASRLMMLDDVVGDQGIAETLKKVVALLQQTPHARKNRLISDLVSFVMMCAVQHKGDLDRACRKVGHSKIEGLLGSISPTLTQAFGMEKEAKERDDICEFWGAWLKNIPFKTAETPLHLFFHFLDKSDWTVDLTMKISNLFVVAKLMYQSFI